MSAAYEEERYGLDDFNSIPSLADDAWRATQDGDAREARAPASVRIVDFTTFVSKSEPSAEPLLGTPSNTLLPLDGMLLMYGDGGAGKTTLSIDAVSHLAAGVPWLGIPVERPVKTLLIENEGPRGKFRQRLSEKHAAWNGATPFSPNVAVLEEPWTRFTLREPAHRESLAATIGELETDLVVMGPLVTLGMVGGGTPDEVSAFEELLLELRELVARAVSFWIIHHENKAGDISGAWERVPDALCHVQALGNGHTRLVWQKARWADEFHKTTVDLVWADGRSFTVREDEEVDHEAELVAAFAADNQWRTANEAKDLVGRRHKPVVAALGHLVERGEMEFMKGPPGRRKDAQCWRLVSVPETREHVGTLRPLEGLENVSVPGVPPPKGGTGKGTHTSDPSSVPGPEGTDTEGTHPNEERWF